MRNGSGGGWGWGSSLPALYRPDKCVDQLWSRLRLIAFVLVPVCVSSWCWDSQTSERMAAVMDGSVNEHRRAHQSKWGLFNVDIIYVA